MSIIDVKREYNYWLGRYMKAEAFINSSTEEVIEKHLELFYQVVKELSKLIDVYFKLTGKEMTSYEKSNGFKEV